MSQSIIISAQPRDPLPIARRVPTLEPILDDILEPILDERRTTLTTRVRWAIASGVEAIFGVAMIVVGLAIIAAIPVLQLAAFGYLLEASARVARTGRLRDGFIGVRTAARLGGIVAAAWLFLIPVRIVSDLAHSATIIDGGSRAVAAWRLSLFVLIALTTLHVMSAVARGGKLRHFAWPFNIVWFVRRLRRGGYYAEARDTVWETAVGLRLPYYFWLGTRGLLATLAWLAIPVTMLALWQLGKPGATLISIIGAVLLAWVLLYLPFLQVQFALENRFAAAFELRRVRQLFSRAPWAFTISFFFTLLFAVPLYLLKVEVVPREAAWLPGLVFLVFIYPARLLVGWAYGRAIHRERRRHWFWRWTARVPLVPVVALYLLIVFLSQYTSWNGVVSLYEQHAFLLPVPN